MFKLILASQSPRRKQLLEKAGFSFVVLPSQVSETPNENLNPGQQILDIARRKAKGCLESNKQLKSQDYIILASDTEVVLNGRLLGKPENQEQSASFLRYMSGREHEVMTGVSLINCKSFEQFDFLVRTQIYFRNLSEEEIQVYVQSNEPYDKAGGYGIQGEGGKFVDKVVGPMDNVIGLPVEELIQVLNTKGWKILKS